MAFETKISKRRFKGVGYTGAQMYEVANTLITKSLVPRIGSGLDVNDQPAPALNKDYKKLKQRKGLKGIRNWIGVTQRTLKAMKVLRASDNRAVIGFKDRTTNRRAYMNNARYRMFGVGPGRDTRALTYALGKLPPFVKVVSVH